MPNGAVSSAPAGSSHFERHLGAAPAATSEEGDAAPDQGAAYRHLTGFCRMADAEQSTTLWQAVGAAMHALTGTPEGRQVWLNCQGEAVPWLHVRMDSKPTYYRYDPYAEQTTAPRPVPEAGGHRGGWTVEGGEPAARGGGGGRRA